MVFCLHSGCSDPYRQGLFRRATEYGVGAVTACLQAAQDLRHGPQETSLLLPTCPRCRARLALILCMFTLSCNPQKIIGTPNLP